MKKTVRVTTFEAEEYTTGWPDFDTANEFMAFFAEKLAEIPEEYRAAAHINFVSRSYDYDSYLTLHICYERPETEEETAARERIEKAQERSKRDRELQELARLKQKYPDPGA